jgi:hypothetical protein
VAHPQFLGISLKTFCTRFGLRYLEPLFRQVESCLRDTTLHLPEDEINRSGSVILTGDHGLSFCPGSFNRCAICCCSRTISQSELSVCSGRPQSAILGIGIMTNWTCPGTASRQNPFLSLKLGFRSKQGIVKLRSARGRSPQPEITFVTVTFRLSVRSRLQRDLESA